MPPWCIPFVGLRPCSRPSIPRRAYVLHPARECLKMPHEELERVAVQRDVRKTLQRIPISWISWMSMQILILLWPYTAICTVSTAACVSIVITIGTRAAKTAALLAATTLPQPARWKQWMWTWNPHPLTPCLIPIPLSVPSPLWGQKGTHPVTRCAKPPSQVEGIAAGCDYARVLSLDNPPLSRGNDTPTLPFCI